MNEDECQLCDTLSSYYTGLIHGYLSIGISIIGIICNLLNIATYSRETMISPINAILLILSAFDLIILLGYIPYVYYTFLKVQYDTFTAHVYALYKLLFAMVGVQLHGMCMWLAVLVGIYRYMIVVHPFKKGIWNSTKKTYFTITSLCLISVVIVLPVCLILLPNIINRTNNSEHNLTLSEGKHFEIDGELKFWFLLYNLILFLIPSIVQTLLITRRVSNTFAPNLLIFSNKFTLTYFILMWVQVSFRLTENEETKKSTASKYEQIYKPKKRKPDN